MTDRRHIVPNVQRNGRPKTAIKLRRFSQKLENTLLRSYFSANLCLFFTLTILAIYEKYLRLIFER